MFLICAENYKRVKVHENGCTDKDERYSISALKRNGEFIKKDFIGFVEKTSLLRPQFVKLVNIVGVYNDIEIIDIPRGHWVLAAEEINHDYQSRPVVISTRKGEANNGCARTSEVLWLVSRSVERYE
nr:hypothetical protein BCU01_18265 [Vibrio splendidus]